jgi:cytochrome b561
MRTTNSHLQTSTEWRYGLPAVLLHWTLAVLLTVMVGLGWYMMSIEDAPNSGWYFDLHKSLGLLVFGLVCARLLWRLTHRPEALPQHLPKWETGIASLTHFLLYICMVLIPLTGALGASFSNKGIAFFGLPLPTFWTANHDIAETFFSIHSAAAWGLIIVVSLHALAGIKHLLINRDNVFQRMWF